MITPRCGKCPACLRVAAVQKQALGVLAREDIRGHNPIHPVGEDIRLIWNRTLEENPCTGSTLWSCACGWKGTSSELVPNPSGGLCCPTCGGSGGLEGGPR